MFFSPTNKKLFPNDSGIYAIFFKNSTNKKRYIGSSKKIGSRWKSHLFLLRNKKSPCVKLQRAFNKYGEDNLILEVIQFIAIENLLDVEQVYINIFDSFTKGYNSRPTARNNTDYKWTKASKKRTSKTKAKKRFKKKRQIISLYKKGISCVKISKIVGCCHPTVSKIIKESGFKIQQQGYKKVLQYDFLTGDFIKMWPSITSCANNFDTSIEEISKKIKGRRIFKEKFLLSFSELQKKEVLKRIYEINKIKLDKKNSTNTPVYQYNIITKKLISSWGSFQQCAENLSRTKSDVVKISRIHRVFNENFVLTRQLLDDVSLDSLCQKIIENDPEIVNIKQISKKGDLLKIWNDVNEIVSFYNLKKRCSITRAITGERKSYKGFIWEAEIPKNFYRK